MAASALSVQPQVAQATACPVAKAARRANATADTDRRRPGDGALSPRITNNHFSVPRLALASGHTGNSTGGRAGREQLAGGAAAARPELTDSGQGGRTSGGLRAQDGGDVVTRAGGRAETDNDRCRGSRYGKRGAEGDARPGAEDTARVRSTRMGYALAGMAGGAPRASWVAMAGGMTHPPGTVPRSDRPHLRPA